MKDSPFFSIVIPVFNRAHKIGTALDSVLSQNFRDFEVIVVDDGSSDEIERVLAPYRSLGVLCLNNAVNSGVGYTRNKGVRAARGEWITFLDSDNQLRKRALAILRSAIATCDEKVGVVYGKSELIGVCERSKDASSGVPIRWDYKKYLGADYIQEALPVTRREILLRFPFEETLGIKRECGALVWYAIGRAGYDSVWTEEVVQRYEISADSLSGKSYLAAHPEEMVLCNEKILEEFGGDLLRLNKKKLITLHQKTAFYCIMAGRSRCALRHARLAWRLDRMNVRTWLLAALCCSGPRAAQRFYLARAGS